MAVPQSLQDRMILPVFASIEKLDGAYIEASHDLYANRWVTLRRAPQPAAAPV